MPRVKVNLDPHKALISDLIRQQHTQDEIRAILADTYGITISLSLLQSRTREWGLVGSKAAAMKV
jgi:hypothetical protein